MMIFRPEIQGLRAIAVLSVLIFHVWPNALPGGYVGVDVFFVISGYLMTALLVREVERDSRVNLAEYYRRRIRRLAPAASLVLLFIIISLPLLPATLWRQTLWEVIAAAFYVENWRLAAQAVDYLGAENARSPVQHYWSLSVEEQFYLIWPVTIGVLTLAVQRLALPRNRTLFLALLIICLVSFGFSVVLTSLSSERAYFVTHTRIWELGIGGLVDLSPALSDSKQAKTIVQYFGLSCILAACIFYSEQTAFPGFMALAPTLGAALVIAVSQPESQSAIALGLGSKPALYIGGISYSLYLWHWPLIIIYLSIWPGEISLLHGLLICIVSFLFAHVTKIYIEDRFRRPGLVPGSNGVVRGGGFQLGIFSVGATAGLAAAVLIFLELLNTGNGDQPNLLKTEQGLSDETLPPRAVSLDELAPSLVDLKSDLPDAYTRGCHLRLNSVKLAPCLYGDTNSDYVVVLMGDSHAAQWIPPLAKIAKARGWRLITHTKSACPVLLTPVVKEGKPYMQCAEWGETLIAEIITLQPDLVIFSQSKGQNLVGVDLNQPAATADAIIELWHRLQNNGIKAIAIADTHRMPFDPGSCISKNLSCEIERAALPKKPDPILIASEKEKGLKVIRMVDAYCTQTHCPFVIGDVIVWRDTHHLTRTYSEGLEPLLAARLDDALE